MFKHAAVAGLDVDLQAKEKAKALLGAQGDQTKPIAAMSWREVPAFYLSMDEGTITHLALRLLILTALRSKLLRFLHVDHIDGDILTVTAEYMKGRRGRRMEFRVPLSQEALSVIEGARKFDRKGYLFPSVRKGVISDATMSRLMDRRGMRERPHGFRSSFRTTWCPEATDMAREVAETALAHVSGGKVVLAYRRTDYFEQGRVLMERLEDQILGNTGQVVRRAE